MKARAFLLALASVGIALPAAAEPQAPRAAVRYADLDLATAAGQAMLATRIEWAAREVCKVTDERTGSMLPAPHAKACYQRAKSTALEQVAEHVARARSRG